MTQSYNGVLSGAPSRPWMGFIALGAFIGATLMTVASQTEGGRNFAHTIVGACARLDLCDRLILDQGDGKIQAAVLAYPSEEIMRELIPSEYVQLATPTSIFIQCRVRADGGIDTCGGVGGPLDNRLLAGAIHLVSNYIQMRPEPRDGRPVDSTYVFQIPLGYGHSLRAPANVLGQPSGSQRLSGDGLIRSAPASESGASAKDVTFGTAPSEAVPSKLGDAVTDPAAAPVESRQQIAALQESAAAAGSSKGLSLLDISAMINSNNGACQPWRLGYEKPPYTHETVCWDSEESRRFYRDKQGRFFWSDGTPRAAPRQPQIVINPFLPTKSRRG
jgi:hypothetical protein